MMVSAPAADEPLVELREITRRFVQADRETQVLRGISLTMHRGDFLALMGSSGSGKSTLLHILGVLDQPDSGTYHLNGYNVAGLGDEEASLIRSRFIGFVFQSFYLMPQASALENVMLPGMYTGEGFSSMRKRAMALLDQVGLADRAGHTPAQLSGGQQQRVSLARALFNRPDLLLADEPTGQLDAATSTEILALLKEINATGTSIVVVTHDPQTARVAKQCIRVHDGLVMPDEPNDFSVNFAGQVDEMVTNAMELMTTLGFIGAGISFFVGSLGIFSIMILMVHARKTEIGIRRAVGAPKRLILLQFLFEAGLMAGTGGALGVGVALALTQLVAALGLLPAYLNISLALGVCLLSLTCGLLAGGYPAWKAAKLEVLAALRE